MDIKRSCVLSPIISTSQNRSTLIYPLELNPGSIDTRNFSPIMNIYTPEKPDLLAEQIHLEHDIAHQSSIKTQELFINTYSSLQTIVSQMQLKLASVFLQEIEYLQQHEEKLEQEEQRLTKSTNKIKNIQNQREQIENEFFKIKDRLEIAISQVTSFHTDGAQHLQALFSESHQIDEQLSALICECIASLSRSRIMVNGKINDFSQKSDCIQSELTDREILIHNTKSSITLMFELVNTLNQLNVEHSQDITIAATNFQKQYQEFTNELKTTNIHWNINKQMDEIHLLEKEKIKLENELIERTLILENIYTILGTITGH